MQTKKIIVVAFFSVLIFAGSLTLFLSGNPKLSPSTESIGQSLTIQTVDSKNLKVDKQFLDNLRSKDIETHFSADTAFQDFLMYSARINDKNSVLIEMLNTARPMQNYVADGFNDVPRLKISRYGTDFLATSTNKEYLEKNAFYVIDLFTYIPMNDKIKGVDLLLSSQQNYLQWKNLGSHYNEDKFVQLLKLTTKNISTNPLYSSAAVQHLNVNNYVSLFVEKVKDSGQGVFQSADDTSSFFIRIADNDSIFKKQFLADGKLSLSHTKVIVSGSELSEINTYLKTNQTMVKFPLMFKLDCMTKLQESMPFDLMFDVSGDPDVFIAKSTDNVIKLLKQKENVIINQK